MNGSEWLKCTGLSSPITAVSVLLVGHDGKSPTKAIGTGVFVSTGLIMTARHVIDGFWSYYGDPKVKLHTEGTKKADFSVYAVQFLGDGTAHALWATKNIASCPYSDLAVISVVPANDLAKSYPFPLMPYMDILPPAVGEEVAAFGYADTSVLSEDGDTVKFQPKPLSTIGKVTEVWPESRDSAVLPFPCFSLEESAFIGGMSGGPIFNKAGHLCGLICTGFDGVPVVYGSVLWPMLGIPIQHAPPPSTVVLKKYPMAHLAKLGLMFINGWDYVDTNVEEFIDVNGNRRVRLKPLDKPGCEALAGCESNSSLHSKS
jgi:hypothetical protein